VTLDELVGGVTVVKEGWVKRSWVEAVSTRICAGGMMEEYRDDIHVL
jgi:hypothetical protein